MKIYATILFLILLNTIYAQHLWENYTCSNKIYDLTAVNNLLWVSTVGGCATVDQSSGYIQQYNRSNTGLPDVFINGVNATTNGNLWFDVYLNGITKYDGSNWTNYNMSNSGIPDNNVAYVKEDTFGNVWMISVNQGSLVKFDGTTWTSYNSTNASLPVYLGNYVFDNAGGLWMRTSYSGLVYFDGTAATTYDTTNSQIPSNNITDISIDALGNVWLSFDVGIAKFDGLTWEVYNTTNSLIPSDKIVNIVVNNNEVWGVYGDQGTGLFMFNGTSWFNYNSINSNLPTNILGFLQITSNGDKWILAGSWPNSDLIQFDNFNVTYHSITNSPLGGNEVLDLEFDDNGKLWIADYGENMNGGQLVSYQNYNWETNYEQTAVSWLTLQNDSTIWIGMYNRVGKFVNGTTTQYNTLNSGLSSNTVFNSAIDTNGNIWFSTSNGLSMFDGTNWMTYKYYKFRHPSGLARRYRY